MNAAAIRKDESAGFLASVVFHALFLAAGSVVLARPVEYAVEAGAGGIEICFTAAPTEAVSEAPVAVEQESPVVVEEPLEKPEPDDMHLPQNEVEKQEAPEQPVAKPDPARLTAVNSPIVGDGSSPIPGKDKTTFYSGGGAMTEAKPNYLKNPAPAYPWEAREKGWEGVVVLRVAVDKSGKPVDLEKEKSSGYDILDQSAMKAVRKWRFRPAQLGALPVDSTVIVPVRFELENLKKKV